MVIVSIQIVDPDPLHSTQTMKIVHALNSSECSVRAFIRLCSSNFRHIVDQILGLMSAPLDSFR